MSPENIARVDAYCQQISALADALNALHAELSELRDELRGVVDDQRQEPLPLKEAA
jgi:prefoldin subunit 5